MKEKIFIKSYKNYLCENKDILKKMYFEARDCHNKSLYYKLGFVLANMQCLERGHKFASNGLKPSQLCEEVRLLLSEKI